MIASAGLGPEGKGTDEMMITRSRLSRVSAICVVALGVLSIGCGDTSRDAPAASVAVGDDYSHAQATLPEVGAIDWSATSGYALGSVSADKELTISYHHLADGYELTLMGSRPAGQAPDGGEPFTVSWIGIVDSRQLRAGKAEMTFKVARVSFRDGRTFPDGLPPSALYLYLDRSEVVRRMQAYAWQPMPPEPFPPKPDIDGWPSRTGDAPAGPCEVYELDTLRLYLQYGDDDGQTLTGIAATGTPTGPLDADGYLRLSDNDQPVHYEVFNQSWLIAPWAGPPG